ncbi:MAG: hydrogenase formation protein HypD [Candidatus Eisenbacteria bacterium]
MIDLERFHSEPQAKALVERIHELTDGPTALMEVCGTHTVAISRFGLRSLMPDELKLLSGPGCPVCVTPLSEIDRAIAIAREPGAIVTTFGDMMRVPGSDSTLEREKADGADVRILYSPLEALDVAVENPKSEVVFIGVGFETTAPTVAATVQAAAGRGIENFSVLPFFKLVPPALHMLAELPGRALDGLICPGHVSVIIGSGAYEPVAEKHDLPCVVVGFEPLDVLGGVVMLLEQVRRVRRGGRASVENEYGRAVTREGNLAARAILSDVFQVCDAEWREIGTIAGSGYDLSESVRDFDARERFDVELPECYESSGCVCGDIMLGKKIPTDCPLFAARCVPRDPVGPCMVSTEGACAAFYKYERTKA